MTNKEINDLLTRLASLQITTQNAIDEMIEEFLIKKETIIEVANGNGTALDEDDLEKIDDIDDKIENLQIIQDSVLDNEFMKYLLDEE